MTSRTVRVLLCPDKMRGSADAVTVTAALRRGIASAFSDAVVSVDIDGLPLSDGGEGFLDAFSDAQIRTAKVHDALGRVVAAPWAWDHRSSTAYIESAQIVGHDMLGDLAGTDPVGANTRGLGECILEVLNLQAKRIVIGLGGSATTDGGRGMIDAIASTARLSGVEIVAACDVTTRYLDAAKVFGPQKGATPVEVELLTRRLAATAQYLSDLYQLDHEYLVGVVGGGAAGGLGGALAALGARLVPGVDLIDDEIGLTEAIEAADLVVTGEGYVDGPSLDGKVVGGVLQRARASGTPVVVVGGQVDPAVADSMHQRASVAGNSRLTVIDLSDRFGLDQSMNNTEQLLELIGAQLGAQLLSHAIR